MRDGITFGAGEQPEQPARAVRGGPDDRADLDAPIETKLHPPGTRREWQARPTFIQHLADAAARLVLVAAPAGYGKTTLVAQWRSSTAEDRRFAWVSLDRDDNDPGRLWWYVVTALQRTCPELDGESILRELRAQTPEVTETVLPMLANELAALAPRLVLVLDDYHLVRNRTCHDQVAFLLLHLPPSVQMVIITRADPALPLARLRATGGLAEIRARELRFAAAEAAALVESTAAVQLREPDLAELIERTEGWPAGVYLAALSLRGQPSPGDFVHRFSGDNRLIVDFLAEEVFGRQPQHIQRFLARTSVLTRFCAPLCEAVTGEPGAAEVIEVIERENLFVVSLDDNRRWFRYHHLFAQLLRRKLSLTEPGMVAVLHERASAWHRRHGSADEAVSHALAAGDPTRATDLIAHYWYPYVDAGRTETVRRWMHSIGEDRIAAIPRAAHWAAWTAALSGERESARRWLPVIEAAGDEGPLADGMQSLRSSAALLRGVFGFDGLQPMLESAVTAAKIEDNPASPWYALARGALGFSLYLSGEPTLAARPLEEAVQSEASSPLVRLLALSALSLVLVDLDRLSSAEELADAALALTSHGDVGKTPHSALAYAAAGAVYAARGRADEAREQLEHALASRRRVPGISPWPTLVAVLLLAEVLLDAGDDSGAAELAEGARAELTALGDGAEALQARLTRLDRRMAGLRPAEPLTERELAVLRLLQGTLSLREIGQELFVSANTVKTHTQAIYRKLGVSTRQDAVEQGHQLGIF